MSKLQIFWDYVNRFLIAVLFVLAFWITLWNLSQQYKIDSNTKQLELNSQYSKQNSLKLDKVIELLKEHK